MDTTAKINKIIADLIDLRDNPRQPDTTAPTVVLTASQSDFPAPGTLTLTATPTDNLKVIDRVQFFAGDAPLGTVTAPPWIRTVDITAESETTTYRAVAYDLANNSGEDTTTVTVSIVPAPPADVTPPTVSLNAPASITAAGRIPLTATPADDVAVASVTFERVSPDPAVLGQRSAPPWTLDEPVDLNSDSNGTRVFRVTAVDTSGNTSTPDEASVTVNIAPSADTTPPVVVLTAFLRGRTVILEAEASDASGVKFVKFYKNSETEANRIKTENAAPYEAFLNVSEANNGNMTFIAVATDKSPAANTGRDTKVVNINLSPPSTPAGLSNDGDAFVWSYTPFAGVGTVTGYRTYSRRHAEDIERVIVAETPTPATVRDNTVMDGAQAFYRTYAIVDGFEHLVSEASGTQPARPGWDAGQLVINAPGTYTLSHKNMDPTRPAVVVSPGVTGVILQGRLASAGNGISVGANAEATAQNLRAWSLHPGVEGKGHGYLFDGYKAKTMIMEHCYTENWRFSFYALGAKTSNLQTLRVRYNVMRNCEGRKATADGGYVTTGSYRATPIAHFIQINQCNDIGNAEIAWNVMIQEPRLGFVEDLVNIYASSCVAGNWGKVHDNLAYGGNTADDITTKGYAGCGFITDGVSSTTRFWAFYKNVATTSNAGIGVAHGWDIDVYDNDCYAAGILEDGTKIWGINVGIYGYNYRSDDPIKRVRIYGNRSRYYRPPGTSQNPSPTGTATGSGSYYLTRDGQDGCEMSYANNTQLPKVDDPAVRIATERGYYRGFLERVRAAGITVGAA